MLDAFGLKIYRELVMEVRDERAFFLGKSRGFDA